MTNQPYQYIHVGDNGVGKPENPYIREKRGNFEVINKHNIPDYNNWQTQYGHLTFTCLDAKGNFVKPGRYSVEDFGKPLKEVRLWGTDNWISGLNEAHVSETRQGLYLKAPAEKEEPAIRNPYISPSPIIAPSIEQAAEERYPLTVDPEWERTDNESYSRYNGLQKTKREIFLAGTNHLKQQGWKSKEEVEELQDRIKMLYDDIRELEIDNDNLQQRIEILTTEYKDLLE